MRKLFVSVNSLDTVKKLDRELVEGVILNSLHYSSGLSAHSLVKIAELASKSDFKVLVRVDRLYSEEEIDNIRVYLRGLENAGVYGVLCTDLAVKVLVEEQNYNLRVIYAPETLLTNRYDVEELKNEGFDHCVISKDIPLDDVYDIIDHVRDYCWLRIHGPILLAYSARHYVSSYLEKDCCNRIFEIQESTRDDRLTMIEKESGSWLYGMCLESFDEIAKLLSSPIHTLLVDNIYLSDDYTLKVLELYKEVISGTTEAEKALTMLKDYDSSILYNSLSEIRKTVLDKEKK